MKAISEADFLNWARTKNIVADPGYPRSAILDFEPPAAERRFWEIPQKPERRPRFIASMIELAGDWQTCFAWRHMGSWPSEQHVDKRRLNDMVEYELLAALGAPAGTNGVIAFERSELTRLASLFLITSIFGWSVGEDLYIVPDNAKCILKVDHHGVVHVQFRDPDDVEIWVAAMAERGFPLPEELPDETFKRPAWIKPLGE